MSTQPPQSGQRLKCSASLNSGPLTFLPMMVSRGLGSSMVMIAVLSRLATR
jgi:hypothetical protein